MNLAETSNQLLEQIQDSQSDYPQFPTDTPSERYNEVSAYYQNQIERLEWLIKNNAPQSAIKEQTRFCHGLAIGLNESNWLACVMMKYQPLNDGLILRRVKGWIEEHINHHHHHNEVLSPTLRPEVSLAWKRSTSEVIGKLTALKTFIDSCQGKVKS